MRTLLVYYAEKAEIGALCRGSASGNTDVLELHELSGAGTLKRRFEAWKGSCTHLGNTDISIDAYDTLILATDECFGGISPAMNTFIRDHDLRYKDVICLVFGEGRAAKRAQDALKMRCALSGGTPRCVVTVPVKQLRREEENVLFFVRHKLAV